MPLQRKRIKKSTSILSDFRYYFFTNPKIKTLIKYSSPSERESVSQRILQRLDVDVTKYRVLNIHKIGIDVPTRHVFEELLHWDGKSDYWPNQVARIKRINGNLEKILIYILGLEKITLKWFGSREIKLTPLFNMSALKFQHTPPDSDADNARYLLYECSGGYPIGIFTLYVRSSIVEQNETEKAQLFIMVAFNFYGKKMWFYNYILNWIWEKIHNRATVNILNRIKMIFENKFNDTIAVLERTSKK
jgi:hypothetical protein